MKYFYVQANILIIAAPFTPEQQKWIDSFVNEKIKEVNLPLQKAPSVLSVYGKFLLGT